jgi:hypothetical protein
MHIQGFNGQENDRREDFPSKLGTEIDIGNIDRQQTGSGNVTIDGYRYLLQMEVGAAIALEKYLPASMKKSKKIIDGLSNNQVIRLGRMFTRSTNGNPAMRFLLMQSLLYLVESLGNTNTVVCENCAKIIDENLTQCPHCRTYFACIMEEKVDEKKKKPRKRTTQNTKRTRVGV